MFSALLKTRILAVVNSTFFSTAKKRSKLMKTAVPLLVIFVLLSAMFSFGVMSYQLAAPLIEGGMAELYFALAAIMTFAMGFLGSVFTTGKQLFDSKDNDLLLSMPIPPRYILASRLGVLLILDFVLSSVVFVPSAVIYFMFAPFDLAVLAILVVSFLALPLLIQTVSSLVGWVLHWISSKVRAKNTLTYVFSLLVLVGYVYLMQGIMGGFGSLVASGEEISAALQKALPPVYFFASGIVNADFLQFAFFLICCIIPFLLVYFLLSVTFVKISSAGRGGPKAVAHREGSLKASGATAALVKKELRRFFSLPVYLLNAGFGVIVLLAVSVLAPFFKASVLEMAGAVSGGGDDILLLLAAALMAFCSVMTLTTSSSLSLEGNRLWILKVCPVSTRQIFSAKILMNLVLSLPALTLCSVVCSIVFGFGVVQFFALLFAVTALQVFVAIFGLAANLLFPRFDWVNETVVVKQSASSLVGILGGMLLFMATIFLYPAVFSGVPSVLFLAGFGGVAAVLALLAYLWVFRAGVKRFNAL